MATAATKPRKTQCVECPNCGGIFHRTTSQYRRNEFAHPGMLTLLDSFANLGWEQPPPDPSAGYGVLKCPGCEHSLAPSGYLTIKALTSQEVKDAIRQNL